MSRHHGWRSDEHEHEHVRCSGCGRDDVHTVLRPDGARVYALHSIFPGQSVACPKQSFQVPEISGR